ncbi:unnamed protein product [Prunus armeniaca]|nr:unnamed protein product [Prunus armeniaca]
MIVKERVDFTLVDNHMEDSVTLEEGSANASGDAESIFSVEKIKSFQSLKSLDQKALKFWVLWLLLHVSQKSAEENIGDTFGFIGCCGRQNKGVSGEVVGENRKYQFLMRNQIRVEIERSTGIVI